MGFLASNRKNAFVTSISRVTVRLFTVNFFRTLSKRLKRSAFKKFSSWLIHWRNPQYLLATISLNSFRRYRI